MDLSKKPLEVLQASLAHHEATELTLDLMRDAEKASPEKVMNLAMGWAREIAIRLPTLEANVRDGKVFGSSFVHDLESFRKALAALCSNTPNLYKAIRALGYFAPVENHFYAPIHHALKAEIARRGEVA